MHDIIPTRNNTLRTVVRDQSLAVDFTTPVLDFNEMNVAFVQAVVGVQPVELTGRFITQVSLLCDDETFVLYPDSEKVLNNICNNFGWIFASVPFRYLRLKYFANGVTSGDVTIYARGKRT
jgi:hypothetical protein